MNIPLSFNAFQTSLALLQPKRNFIVSGRGFGKSTYFGHKMHEIANYLPGASGVIGAKTFTHVLTSILPSAFAHLERMGYRRDIHYVIGKQPPKNWGLPYQPPVKDFTNYITFFNRHRPVGFFLVSQDREGSGRGPNTDFLMTDETLRLDKKKLDNELRPTIRANKDKFKSIPWHLGEHHSTSMPYSNSTKWILDEGNYYLQDYGIDYFSLWRQVVKMQNELLLIESITDFKLQWNEIQRVRREMKPLLSKDGEILFTLSNAFDNIDNVGLSYIKAQRKALPDIIFQIEIMNALISMTDNGYYALNDDIHIYNDGFDDNYALDIAMVKNYNFAEIGKQTAAFLSTSYYDTKLPIHLFFDWGGTVSFCLAGQYRKETNTLYIIKEFYVLPPGEMAKTLMKQVSQYFQSHVNKRIIFVRDSYGDNTSVQSSKTINEDAITQLNADGWNVAAKSHRYKEPPYYEKWQVMQNVLQEKDSRYFKLRIDGNNCKYLIISMKETKTKQVDDKFSKDKSLERNHNADQRTAPHSTDALDKGCYWLYKNRNEHSFIDISI
jgi:hypothetical protein